MQRSAPPRSAAFMRQTGRPKKFVRVPGTGIVAKRSCAYIATALKSVTNGFVAEDLCLECGLCCNGVIFADVRLQPGDDPKRLKALGLAVANSDPLRRRDSAARGRSPTRCDGKTARREAEGNQELVIRKL